MRNYVTSDFQIPNIGFLVIPLPPVTDNKR